MNHPGWIFERLVVGELLVNCYILGCPQAHQAIVVDPGGDADHILKKLDKLKLTLTAIVNTHGHGDHIGGNDELKKAAGSPLIIGAGDAVMLPDPWLNLSAPFGLTVISPPADKTVKEGDIISFGTKSLSVLDTPGHSPGSISLVGEGFVLAGDLLFEGSVGRTDFPGGSFQVLRQMIETKLYPLGDNCIVYPGHGEATTIGREKLYNPFLQEGITFI